jgi:hypothetical protein
MAFVMLRIAKRKRPIAAFGIFLASIQNFKQAIAAGSGKVDIKRILEH